MQKMLEAQPMLQFEAEARLGREVENTNGNPMGFLICDTETLQWNWIPEELFHCKPCETINEHTFIFQSEIDKWQTFFRQYSKNKKGISQSERMQVYQINKHLKALNNAVCKILNENIINTSNL